jgi:hypothetical protein
MLNNMTLLCAPVLLSREVAGLRRVLRGV